MKKLFILLFVFLFSFTLAACEEDTGLQDSIDALTQELADLEGDSNTANDALQAELDALIQELADLEGDSNTAMDALQAELDALDVVVDDLNGEIDDLNAEDLPFLKQTEIIIMHTNDVHGRVNDDSWSGTMGMATVKNIVDEIDARYNNTFLVSAGDILHGTTFATLEEGESVLNVMNFMEYDMLVPGNHDFDYGQDRLLELELLADFPMISANIQYDADDTDLFEPYIIQDFEGVKVGFFGLTSPETVYKTHPDNVIGLNFLDPIAQAELMVAELEDLVDVIILVAHVGLDDDTLVTTEDIVLAVDGIDVVIDGHSHSTLEHGYMVNDTLIVSTGEYMKNLGVLSIIVQDGNIIGRNSTLISAADAEELAFGADEDVQTYIDGIVAEQEVILNVVVGQTSVVLDGERDDVRTGETNLGNLITDSMLDVTGADIAVTNGGGIRASIPVGDITVGDIITVLPFGNIIVTKDMTGQDIVDILAYGVSSYPDASGKMPHVAGVTFDINTSVAGNPVVQNILVDGVPIVLDAIYTVATNDFLAAGGDGYVMFEDVPTAGEFMGLHEALTTKFTVGTDVVMPVMGRIVVVTSPNLFISEYIEGGSNNKALEIFNPSDATIDLSYYTIREYYGDEATDYNEYQLTGTLDSMDVLVICTDAIDTGTNLETNCDIQLSFPSVAHFNGDDAVQLLQNGVVIDQIGVTALAGGDDFAKDVTLVRKPEITSGSVEFDLTEWTEYAKDTFDYIGDHTYTPAA